MKTPWFLAAWLLIVELLIVLILIPGHWTQHTIKKESSLVEQRLGVQSRNWIQGTAQDWYRNTMLRSGFYDGLYDMLIPSQQERRDSRGLEDMGQGWFGWVEGRIEAFSRAVYQLYTRLALLLTWAPYMLLLFLPAVYDGVMTRKIKKSNFDYTSPVVHRYSIRGIKYAAVGLFLALFIPIALDPIIFPAVMMVCCVLAGLTFGNIQKRV